METNLFNIQRFLTPKGIKDPRKAALQDLVDATGYPLGVILKRTAGMQKVEDLRFVLSSMKATRIADGKHAFNTVMFCPKKTN